MCYFAVADYVDHAVRHVMMRQGVLGVTVSIMLPHDPTVRQLELFFQGFQVKCCESCRMRPCTQVMRSGAAKPQCKYDGENCLMATFCGRTFKRVELQYLETYPAKIYEENLYKSTLLRSAFSVLFVFQGKEGPKIPLSDVITILPPKEEMVMEVTPNFG